MRGQRGTELASTVAELTIIRLFSHEYLGELYGRYKTIERFADFTAETRMVPSVGHETPSASFLVSRVTYSLDRGNIYCVIIVKAGTRVRGASTIVRL